MFNLEYILNLIEYLKSDQLDWQSLGNNNSTQVFISSKGSFFTKDLPLLKCIFNFSNEFSYEDILDTINSWIKYTD